MEENLHESPSDEDFEKETFKDESNILLESSYSRDSPNFVRHGLLATFIIVFIHLGKYKLYKNFPISIMLRIKE